MRRFQASGARVNIGSGFGRVEDDFLTQAGNEALNPAGVDVAEMGRQPDTALVKNRAARSALGAACYFSTVLAIEEVPGHRGVEAGART